MVVTLDKMITSREAKRKYLWHPLLWYALIYAIAITGYMLVVGDVGVREFIIMASVVLIHILILNCLPLLTLFFTHSKTLKNKSLSISGGYLRSVTDSGKTYVVPDDIDFIEHYLSLPLYHKRIDWSFWNHYNYFVFVTKSGSRIVISCLLLDSKALPDYLDVRKKKKLFVVPPSDE